MCARAFPGDLRASRSWCTCTSRCGGVARLCGFVGYPGGGSPELQDVWVQVVEGAEEASLDAGHVLPPEVGLVLAWGVLAQPQQRHKAGCHHVRAEL